MTIAVIGATGTVGTSTVRGLLSRKENVGRPPRTVVEILRDHREAFLAQ